MLAIIAAVLFAIAFVLELTNSTIGPVGVLELALIASALVAFHLGYPLPRRP